MVIGWDIGGVNTKVTAVDGGRVLAAHQEPFELQRDPGRLAALLRDLAARVTTAAGRTPAAPRRHAVTMTAELSQLFRTKREGVEAVLDAVDAAFPGEAIAVFLTDGRFVAPADARALPLLVAAANWVATARMVARAHLDALLIDVGTTTTDIIPIVGGDVVATGWTDPARLTSGELVYTGALRTPVEAITSRVTIGDQAFGVSAEGFALAGDVHLWRGDLSPADYTVPTPDGRPATRAFAGERLARVVCADREMLDEPAIDALADQVASAQVARIAAGIRATLRAHARLRLAVVTGLGAFLGQAAARATGLYVVRLADILDADAARCAPAAAVALLLESDGADLPTGWRPRPCRTFVRDAGAPRVDRVVKVGGGALGDPEGLRLALATLADEARQTRLVIVPGGGPFADAVREADERLRPSLGLAPTAAHWMAIVAMDQYAELLVDWTPDAVRVEDLDGIRGAHACGAVPVLAPSRWLRHADPLPHSWEVTSDSLAAWFAGALGASELLLVKPDAATEPLVDPAFASTLPPGVSVEIRRLRELAAGTRARR